MLIISKYYRFSIKISIKIKLNKCMYNNQQKLGNLTVAKFLLIIIRCRSG